MNIKPINLNEIKPVVPTGRKTLQERTDIECISGCFNSGNCSYPACKTLLEDKPINNG